MSRQLRLDILTRVSRTMGREGDSYGSPETQRKDCRGWIASQGHVEGEHFHEQNVSGGALLASRPGLQAVIEQMRCGESDGVVVRAYDRFMRSVSLSWEVIELIEGRDGHGGIGRLFAAQGNVDFQTPTGRMLFTQLQSLAQYQRENARYEWAVARTRAWERGVWLARPPAGYLKLTAEHEVAGEGSRPHGRSACRGPPHCCAHANAEARRPLPSGDALVARCARGDAAVVEMRKPRRDVVLKIAVDARSAVAAVAAVAASRRRRRA